MDNFSKRPYRQLDSVKVTETTKLLAERIKERFPNSGLLKVAEELVLIACQAEERAKILVRPIWSIRIANILLVFSLALCLLFGFGSLDISFSNVSISELIQVLEAATSEMIVVGTALFLLFGLEGRIKRNQGLAALHELQAMAHIIDMHQLTKDPARLDNRKLLRTDSSPVVSLDAYQLTRYLDYCSEMLAIEGKIAAVYGHNFADSVLLSAVDGIENLTTSLSRKIWQKIVILHDLIEKQQKSI